MGAVSHARSFQSPSSFPWTAKKWKSSQKAFLHPDHPGTRADSNKYEDLFKILGTSTLLISWMCAVGGLMMNGCPWLRFTTSVAPELLWVLMMRWEALLILVQWNAFCWRRWKTHSLCFSGYLLWKSGVNSSSRLKNCLVWFYIENIWYRGLVHVLGLLLGSTKVILWHANFIVSFTVYHICIYIKYIIYISKMYIGLHVCVCF